jgi:hypothetical protein
MGQENGVGKLTPINIFNRVGNAMKTRLASLFLVLVLAGSAFARVPMSFGDGECSMHGMDCCKTALSQQTTPEVADAKLCCALECAHNGTTSQPKGGRITSPSPATPSTHPALVRPLAHQSLVFRPIDRLHGPPDFGPVYLRTLALLI